MTLAGAPRVVLNDGVWCTDWAITEAEEDYGWEALKNGGQAVVIDARWAARDQRRFSTPSVAMIGGGGRVAAVYRSGSILCDIPHGPHVQNVCFTPY